MSRLIELIDQEPIWLARRRPGVKAIHARRHKAAGLRSARQLLVSASGAIRT